MISAKPSITKSLSHSPRILQLKKHIVPRLLRWYRRNGRELPWRKERDPYRVLVSEIMLQQTQMSRVLQKYPLFLKRFPSFQTLARAPRSQVIRAWQGMGYNNRAVRLQQLASTVLHQYRGRLPTSILELQKLPGIGPYTAHALACFVHKVPHPVVDTNVSRVLKRLFPRELKPTQRVSEDINRIWALAHALLPHRHAYDWNQALMDLGALVCTAANPQCSKCPISQACPSAHKITRGRVRRKKQERGRDAIPNRIYRGRIIEFLRHRTNGRGVTFSLVACAVKANYTTKDERWLRGLIRGLERDGLLTIRKKKGNVFLTLPD